jgi:hypothetical protein
MGDFERVGTANLWKSAPIFSTGAEMMELIMKELRLNLCSRARNSDDSLVSEEQEEMGGDFDPRLSTAFAKAGERLPPGARRPGDQS